MTSITTFAYGLTVKTTGLLTAAQAWPTLEEPLRFFDLLLLRKNKGTLRTHEMEGNGTSGLVKMPVEGWEEIKKWLVAIEIEIAEEEILSRYFGRCQEEVCRLKGVTKLRWEMVRDDRLLKDVDDPELCHSHQIGWDQFGDYLYDLSMGYGEVLEPVFRLTSQFGLSHPLSRVVTYIREHRDLDSVAFISLPCQTWPQSHSTISAEAEPDYGSDQHTFVDVDLSLPPNADSRFIRFIRLFNLEVVQVTHSMLQVVKPRWEKETKRASNELIPRAGLAGIEEDKVKVTKEIKPCWKLYTSCSAQW